jgi:hypothetical protein
VAGVIARRRGGIGRALFDPPIRWRACIDSTHRLRLESQGPLGFAVIDAAFGSKITAYTFGAALGVLITHGGSFHNPVVGS